MWVFRQNSEFFGPNGQFLEFRWKPVLRFEVRERNTIFMIVTEWRGIARKEGKILTRETQEKKNSSLAQVVMAKFLQFGILFPQLSCQKPFYSQPKWSSAFRRPFLFYHHAYARSMFDLFTKRYHTYSLAIT